jgi:hypothetical protein
MDFIDKLTNLLLNTQKKHPSQLALVYLFAVSTSVLLAVSVMTGNNTIPTSAQIPQALSPPDDNNGNTITDNQPAQFAITPTPPPPTSNNASTPSIEITSHKDGDQVPVGELTIQGISSDDEDSNCQVYADVNDVKPLQNATTAGPTVVGGEDDFSRWTFTYTQDYQLIKKGANELTAKISCFDGAVSPSAATPPLSKWYSVNITGVDSAAAAATTISPAATITTNTTGEQSAQDVSEDKEVGEVAPGVPPVG